MKCIFGLGNPGQEYFRTRHNVGFMFLDYWAEKLGLPDFKDQTKFHAEISQNADWTFIKPQTFMNDSGRSVQAFLQFFYKEWLQTENLSAVFVAHDDLDLELGTFKLQKGTGPKVHNGLNSIYQHLHTKDFWHIRLGVDSRKGDRTQSGREYVLTNFSSEELHTLYSVFDQVINRISK